MTTRAQQLAYSPIKSNMVNVAYECISHSLIKPFIASTQSVFATMLGSDVEVVDGSEYPKNVAFDISGIISFSGAVQGSAVISLDKEVALAIAETLIGVRPEGIDEDVRDMVGELANMIGGNSKERLANTEVSLGLPTVVTGRGHEVSFEPGAQVCKIYFKSQWGPLAIEIGMRAPRN